MAGVAVRHPCQGRGRGELGGGESDGGHGEGDYHPRGGAHPQHVLDGEERGHAETRGLVLPDDLVTVGQHLGHGRGAGHLDSGYVDIYLQVSIYLYLGQGDEGGRVQELD